MIIMKIAYKSVIIIDYFNLFLYGHSSIAAFQWNQKIIISLADNLTTFLSP